jgi:hypothetical protein
VSTLRGRAREMHVVSKLLDQGVEVFTPFADLGTDMLVLRPCDCWNRIDYFVAVASDGTLWTVPSLALPQNVGTVTLKDEWRDGLTVFATRGR